MNKTKFLTVLVVLLLALNAITLYFVWGKRGDDKHRNGGGGRPYSEYISKKLNFDTAQTEALKKLRDAHKGELEALRNEDKQIQDAKFKLLKDGTTDSLLLDSLTNLSAANKKKFELAFHKHFMQIRALCRPEQVELFKKTIEEMQKRRMPPQGGKDRRP